MTRRYNLTDEACMHELLAALQVDLGPLPVLPNIAPTDYVPVIHHWEGQRLISRMRWWLVPHWSKGPTSEYPMFNASRERLRESRAWHGCFRHKRAVIPARSYIDWCPQEDGHQACLIERPDQAMAFAGLWDYWTDGVEHVLSCSIITRPAPKPLQRFGSTFPAILQPGQAEIWLDHTPDLRAAEEVLAAPLALDLKITPLAETLADPSQKALPAVAGEAEYLTLS